jgi:formate/nitrite transporter FocA (FNT family)
LRCYRTIPHWERLTGDWRDERCITTLPLAWLLTETGKVAAGFDASVITIPGIVHNLVPVTLGNIVGDAGMVGFVY